MLEAATFFESVCHVPDKAALFRELARVLEPGARIGGMDWIQRPFGDNQLEEQIMKFIGPANELFTLQCATIETYRKAMEDAGLRVFIARDVYAGVKCWGAVQDQERPEWDSYEGPEQEMFRKGEAALSVAREAGVFSIGMWIAGKPS